MSQTKKERVVSEEKADNREVYEDGSAVRRLRREPQQNEPKKTVSKSTMRNRKRAMQMNRLFVLFLTLISVISLKACINLLEMKAEITNLNKRIAEKQDELSKLKTDNDAYYNEIISSVDDMEKIKDTAINEFGMNYAEESQIQQYSTTKDSYVRQYQDVPKAK